MKKTTGCIQYIFESVVTRIDFDVFNNELSFQFISDYALDYLVRLELQAEEDWVQSYRGYGNILLELWSKVLVIEAKVINIDGEDFPV